METQRRPNSTLLRLSAYCGIAAPVVFILSLIIFGALHPNFSHVSDFVSVLSAQDAPYEVYMNGFGIIPFGVFILLFSYAYISAHLPRGIGGWASGIAVAIVGSLFIIAGFNTCDPNCDLTTPTTEALIHNYTASGAFMMITFAAMLISLRIRRKDDRFSYYRLALVCFFGLVGGIVGLVISGEEGAVVGLVQRIFLGFVWAFLIISAIFILRWQGEET